MYVILFGTNPYMYSEIVYNQNHYFGFGLILKTEPKYADTFGGYRNRYQNHIPKVVSSNAGIEKI